MSDKLKELKQQLGDIGKEISEVKSKKSKINREYVDLLKEDCKENIGRCFVRLFKGEATWYLKIVDIYRETTDKQNEIHFNEYQYPAICFSYPFDESTEPFYEEGIFSGSWENGGDYLDKKMGFTYKEITNEEYMDKFKEVSEAWINDINSK